MYNCKYVGNISLDEVIRNFSDIWGEKINDLNVIIYGKIKETTPNSQSPQKIYIMFIAIECTDNNSNMDCFRIENLVCDSKERAILYIGFLVNKVIQAREKNCDLNDIVIV